MSIRILFPLVHNIAAYIYFKGYIKICDENLITIYITKYSTRDIFLEEDDKGDDFIYGYCSYNLEVKRKWKRPENFLILCNQLYPQVQEISIHGKQINIYDNYIIILYDHNVIRNSEALNECKDFISKLQILVKSDHKEEYYGAVYVPTFRNLSWLVSSMFMQHMCNYLNMLIWLVLSIGRNRKVSMKEGNLILSILVDILIGYLILELFFKDNDKKDLGYLLMGFLEKLVNSMYSLLKWLMGSPAGLKLNNAFNKMLGKYFSYHIELWWLFLDVSGEKLDLILHLYKYIGYLGFTFQAAIIADMICLATFHSYCIYVYAARLFNIQISGLTALLRLFVGKKYNPLRGGIDSCEYTNQELFVGTVAFTILLLLLPTTVMYYIVFTLFRVLSIFVQYILAKSIYLIQTLPLYVIILWLTRSSKVAGNVLIEEVKNARSSVLLLRLKLFNKSIRDLVTHFRPPVDEPKHIEWSNMLSNIVTGKQII